MNRIVPILFLLLLALLIGGVIWLAGSPMAPPQEKVQQTIPDDRIPH